jgi:hypothetical protein
MAPTAVCAAFFALNAGAMAYLATLGVPLRDAAFVFGSLAYAAVANRLADKPLPGTVTRRVGTVSAQRSVRLLFPLTLSLSIGAPWALLATDRALVALLVPSLFLVHAQLALETMTYAFRQYVSVYVRVLLPIMFVSYRVDTFCKLLHAAWLMAAPRALLLRLVAAGNLVFWGYSLVGFLLPYVVPRNFVVPEEDLLLPGEWQHEEHNEKVA